MAALEKLVCLLGVERASSSLPTTDARNRLADFILIMPPVAELAEQETAATISMNFRTGRLPPEGAIPSNGRSLAGFAF